MLDHRIYVHLTSARTALALALLTFTSSALATQADLCASFKNTQIDRSLIDTMLEAADNNYLYRIDTSNSRMRFCVDSPIGRVEGRFKNFQGGLALKASDSQSLVSIEVDSLDTDLLFIETLLKGDDFFDAEGHPELIFVSTEFEWINKKRAILKGKLSMNGITKAVAFYVEINDHENSDRILVKATTTINRSEFGMSALSSMVSDKVNLCMSIEAQRYNPAV